MKTIIEPKLIAIDSSILGKVAKDISSKAQNRRNKASKFLSTISDRGLIPFFCMHHFQEILQHDNDIVVYNRLSLIKSFQQVAWIKPKNQEGLVGSIIDVQGTEIATLINDPYISVNDLITVIKQDLVCYSSGEIFMNAIEEELLMMRKLNLFKTQKSKAIDSITHASNPDINNTKLSILRQSQLKNPSEVYESMKLLRESLKQHIQTRGDRKLENQDAVIDEYFKEVINYGSKMFEPNQDSLYKKFINSSGLEEDEVDENWTVGDLGDYAVFKKKIEIIARNYNFDLKKALKIPQNLIPSWFIWIELDRKISQEKFASGSNLIDKYLASLAFYADILIVDKRVKEYLNQIIKKNKNISFIKNKVIKLSKYEYLDKTLDGPISA